MITIIVFLINYSIMGLAGQNAVGITVPICIIATSVAFAIDVNNSKTVSPFIAPIMSGYFLRIMLMLLDIFGRNIYQLPGSGADSEGFYHATEKVINGYSTNYTFFPTFMGTLMRPIGIDSRVLLQFCVIMFSIVGILFLAKTLNLLSIDKITKRRTLWIVCLLPNFAILSSIYLRESVMVMFISISVFFFARWIKEAKEIFFVIAVALVFSAALFHSGTIGLAIGYMFIRFIYDNKEHRFQTNTKSIALGVICLLTFVFLYLNYGEVFFLHFTKADDISDISSGVAFGGSSYAQYVGNSSSILNMIIYTIPRMIYFLFSPFPWQWRGISDIIAFVFNATYYFTVVVQAVIYCKNNSGNKTELIVFLIIALCSSFVFSWGTSNTGTATRHRDKFVLLYGVVYALSRKKDNGLRITTNGKRIF